MSQQYRLAIGGKGWSQQRPNNNNQNKQKFNDLRKNHELRSLKLKIIGNKNRPAEILTARKAKQESSTNRAAKIQANLQHMQEAARKKKQAQELYYGQGRSPLVRKQNFKPQNQTPKNNKVNNVQQRLGNNKSVTFSNTNMNKTNPKKQFVPQNKQNKMNRIQNYNNKIQNRRNFNNQQNFNNKNNVRTKNPRTGEVTILRPLGRKTVNNNARQPQNFTVSVGNKRNNMRQNNQMQKHHVVSELNPTIQQEIRMIQSSSTMVAPQGLVAQVPNMLEETQVPIMTTRTTLHERFSRI